MTAKLVAYTNTKPKPPRTGHVHPKCYARGMADCSDTITREHYISKNVLDAMGGSFRVHRPHWGGEPKMLPSSALTAKILCQRHNNGLSDLDTAGGKFVDALRSWNTRLTAGGGREDVNGFDVERWLLKVACGFVRLDDDDVPDLWARILFCWNDLVGGRGMHVNASVGDDVGATPDELAFSTAYNNKNERVGFRVDLCGYSFNLSLDGKRVFGANELGKRSILRPGSFRWTDTASGAVYEIGLSWPAVASGPAIDISV